MAYQRALDENEVQSLNLKSIRDWIEKHKGEIKAAPGKTVLYAGRGLSVEVTKGMNSADQAKFEDTELYKRIQELQKKLHDRKIPCSFQTLENVLTAIKSHPVIINRDRKEHGSSHAYEFFDDVKTLGKLLQNPQKTSEESWNRLSAIFATNAEGHVRILDGFSDEYKKLEGHQALIQKELPALLKNDKISASTKTMLQKKLSLYWKELAKDHAEIKQRMREDKVRLKGR